MKKDVYYLEIEDFYKGIAIIDGLDITILQNFNNEPPTKVDEATLIKSCAGAKTIDELIEATGAQTVKNGSVLDFDERIYDKFEPIFGVL